MREKLSLSVTFNTAFLWKQGKCNCASSVFNRARKIMPCTFFKAAADLASMSPQGSASPLRTLAGWAASGVGGDSPQVLCVGGHMEPSARGPSQRVTPAPERLPVTSSSYFCLVRLLQYCVFKVPL